MKKLVVLLLVSLMATSAFAQIDPDTNGIGVYFDAGATTHELMGQAPSVPFSAYVCITNPTNDVSGLEFGYNIVVPAGMEAMFFRLANVLPVGSIDLGVNTNIFSGDYIVGLASPLPASQSVVFVSWTWMMLAPGLTMEFYLGASSIPSLPDYDGPAYEAGGFILPLGQSTGGLDNPVAAVNMMAPVAIENASFGSVKSLFR
jgi:hypothetical protein